MFRLLQRGMQYMNKKDYSDYHTFLFIDLAIDEQ